MPLPYRFNGRNIPVGETVYIGETKNPNLYYASDPMVVKKATVLQPRGLNSSSRKNVVPIAFWKNANTPPDKSAPRQTRPWQFLLTEDQVRQAARLDNDAPPLPEEYPIDVVANDPEKSEGLAITIACAGLGRALPTVTNLEAIPALERQ